MISIYDFSILPFALGDILTWNVKQQVKALSMGEKFIDVYLCDEMPINLHQEKHINSGNSKSHLTDLIPAFYTNPMLRNLHIFHSREEMLNCCFDEDKESHENKISNSREWYTANKTLFDEVSTHSDINEYSSKNGKIPELVAPVGFDPLHYDPLDRKIIAIHLRSRATQSSLEVTETHRDASIKIWSEFINKASDIYSDTLFILLGKNGKIVSDLLNCPELIYPRVDGWTLSEELGLLSHCKGFMGSCSGFASMASFTKTPYLICKCDERSYLNYGISLDKNQLPFATPHQFVSREETPELLMQHLERILSI